MTLPYYSVVQVLVPEDSVTPETQTLVVLIRRKGCVGCFETIFIKITRFIHICLNKLEHTKILTKENEHTAKLYSMDNTQNIKLVPLKYLGTGGPQVDLQ